MTSASQMPLPHIWENSRVQKGPEGALNNKLVKDVVLRILVITFTDVQIMTQVDTLFIPLANLRWGLYLPSELRKLYGFA